MTEVAGFDAYDPAFAGGVNVAVGNVMGDGALEIITGAGPGGGPHVRVWSLANDGLTEVAGFYAFNPAFAGGVNVTVGNVMGDGLAELITGAGPDGGPHVRVWSLANQGLTEVAGFYAFDPAFTGGVRLAVGDMDGDGVAEIATGAGPGGEPRARVWSLANQGLTEIVGFVGYDPAFRGGLSVAVGDFTGDGVAEVIIGAGSGGGPHVKVLDVSGVTVK